MTKTPKENGQEISSCEASTGPFDPFFCVGPGAGDDCPAPALAVVILDEVAVSLKPEALVEPKGTFSLWPPRGHRQLNSG